MYKNLICEYGDPENKVSNFKNSSVLTRWMSDTSVIVFLKMDGCPFQVSYSIQPFDWDTMDLSAGESIVQYSVPLE